MKPRRKPSRDHARAVTELRRIKERQKKLDAKHRKERAESERRWRAMILDHKNWMRRHKVRLKSRYSEYRLFG